MPKSIFEWSQTTAVCNLSKYQETSLKKKKKNSSKFYAAPSSFVYVFFTNLPHFGAVTSEISSTTPYYTNCGVQKPNSLWKALTWSIIIIIVPDICRYVFISIPVLWKPQHHCLIMTCTLYRFLCSLYVQLFLWITVSKELLQLFLLYLYSIQS